MCLSWKGSDISIIAHTGCIHAPCKEHLQQVLGDVLRCLHWNMQLLGELLLDRANVKVMMRYVSDSKNLQMMMMLLKDNSRSIQFEAFHVFKVPPYFDL